MSEIQVQEKRKIWLMPGGDWKAKKLRKQGRGSRTPGIKKGIRPSAIQRYMCTRNRSWKHPLYGQVMESLGQRKKSK